MAELSGIEFLACREVTTPAGSQLRLPAGLLGPLEEWSRLRATRQVIDLSDLQCFEDPRSRRFMTVLWKAGERWHFHYVGNEYRSAFGVAGGEFLHQHMDGHAYACASGTYLDCITRNVARVASLLVRTEGARPRLAEQVSLPVRAGDDDSDIDAVLGIFHWRNLASSDEFDVPWDLLMNLLSRETARLDSPADVLIGQLSLMLSGEFGEVPATCKAMLVAAIRSTESIRDRNRRIRDLIETWQTEPATLVDLGNGNGNDGSMPP